MNKFETLEDLAGDSDDYASSDGSELFDVEFVGHLEDAETRSCLLRVLISARTTCGLTQTAVARAMETTQSAVSQLEGGSTDPRLSTLQRYARAVGGCLQVDLNLIPAVGGIPHVWPALDSPPSSAGQIFLTNVLRSGELQELMHERAKLTSPRDLDEAHCG